MFYFPSGPAAGCKISLNFDLRIQPLPASGAAGRRVGRDRAAVPAQRATAAAGAQNKPGHIQYFDVQTKMEGEKQK